MPKTIIEQMWDEESIQNGGEEIAVKEALRLFAEKVEKEIFHHLPDIATGGKEGYLVLGTKWQELKKREGIGK